MLSNHDISLQRISWGMAAVAIVTATGLALTASGSRAAQQMAAITDKVEGADFAKLSDLVSQPATASVPANAEVAAVAAVPTVPAVPAVKAGDDTWSSPPPMVPPAPIVPAADMIAPVAPVPPAPPIVRSEKNRITVTHADGRVETHRIPTEAEIARMVPVVDVRNGCDGSGQTTSRSESVDANGRRHIKVRICQDVIDRTVERAQAQAERGRAQAERGRAQAERARVQADRAGRLADADMARADRARRTAHVAALSSLRASRAQIANNWSMPREARAEALRDLDESIAELRSEQD